MNTLTSRRLSQRIRSSITRKEVSIFTALICIQFAFLLYYIVFPLVFPTQFASNSSPQSTSLSSNSISTNTQDLVNVYPDIVPISSTSYTIQYLKQRAPHRALYMAHLLFNSKIVKQNIIMLQDDGDDDDMLLSRDFEIAQKDSYIYLPLGGKNTDRIFREEDEDLELEFADLYEEAKEALQTRQALEEIEKKNIMEDTTTSSNSPLKPALETSKDWIKSIVIVPNVDKDTSSSGGSSLGASSGAVPESDFYAHHSSLILDEYMYWPLIKTELLGQQQLVGSDLYATNEEDSRSKAKDDTSKDSTTTWIKNKLKNWVKLSPELKRRRSYIFQERNAESVLLQIENRIFGSEDSTTGTAVTTTTSSTTESGDPSTVKKQKSNFFKKLFSSLSSRGTDTSNDEHRDLKIELFHLLHAEKVHILEKIFHRQVNPNAELLPVLRDNDSLDPALKAEIEAELNTHVVGDTSQTASYSMAELKRKYLEETRKDKNRMKFLRSIDGPNGQLIPFFYFLYSRDGYITEDMQKRSHMMDLLNLNPFLDPAVFSEDTYDPTVLQTKREELFQFFSTIAEKRSDAIEKVAQILKFPKPHPVISLKTGHLIGDFDDFRYVFAAFPYWYKIYQKFVISSYNPKLIHIDTYLNKLIKSRRAFNAAPQPIQYVKSKYIIPVLYKVRHPIKILVFFGTWCTNCKFDITVFVKIMKLVRNPLIQVEYTSIDNDNKQQQPQLESELTFDEDQMLMDKLRDETDVEDFFSITKKMEKENNNKNDEYFSKQEAEFMFDSTNPKVQQYGVKYLPTFILLHEDPSTKQELDQQVLELKNKMIAEWMATQKKSASFFFSTNQSPEKDEAFQKELHTALVQYRMKNVKWKEFARLQKDPIMSSSFVHNIVDAILDHWPSP